MLTSTGQNIAPGVRWEALKSVLAMNNVGQESRWPEAGTVGALCRSGDGTQRPDFDFLCAGLRMTWGKNFGLGALLRSKANSNLIREGSTSETLACYSTFTLDGALAFRKGSRKARHRMPFIA